MNLTCIENTCTFCQRLKFYIEILNKLYTVLCVRWTFVTIKKHFKLEKVSEEFLSSSLFLQC